MELKGLERIVERLKEKKIKVKEIVTDGHLGIQKWLKTNWEVIHYLDVWHVAKGYETIYIIFRKFIVKLCFAQFGNFKLM